MASKRNEDRRLEIENIELYQSYKERLINLALSQFEWHGLPDTVDRRYMEMKLLEAGSVAWYVPEGLSDWWCTGWLHANGTFDAYGYPTQIRGLDFNGRNIEVSQFKLLYDNMSRVPLMPKLDIYAKRLYEADQTFRQNLRMQNTPFMVATSKEELLSVKNIFKRVFSFDPVVEIKNSAFDIDKAVKTLDMKVPFIGKELLEVRQTLWADALSMLGITSETTKKERLISDEIAINRQEDTISLNARLLTRVELCNWMNEKHDMELSVNLSETVVSTAELAAEPMPGEGE